MKGFIEVNSTTGKTRWTINTRHIVYFEPAEMRGEPCTKITVANADLELISTKTFYVAENYDSVRGLVIAASR